MPGKWVKFASVGVLGLGVGTSTATAAETVNVAIGHMGLFWNSIVTMLGEEKGFFEEQGIALKTIATRGGAETVQAVTAGDMHIGIANGSLGVIAAYKKGLPVRIISSEMIGTADIYWIVRADSPLKQPKDIDGHSLAYSRPGSSTNIAALSVADFLGVKPKFVSVGGPSASRTQVMTGQVDAGWQAPPGGLDLVQRNEARILLKGDMAKSISDISIRVNIANADWLEKNRDAARKYMLARQKTIDWMFGEGRQEAIDFWAKRNKLDSGVAKAAVDFYTPDRMRLAPLGNLEKVVDLAIEHKFIEERLTDAEKKELVQILVQ